jgi:hypothetical protein
VEEESLLQKEYIAKKAEILREELVKSRKGAEARANSRMIGWRESQREARMTDYYDVVIGYFFPTNRVPARLAGSDISLMSGRGRGIGPTQPVADLPPMTAPKKSSSGLLFADGQRGNPIIKYSEIFVASHILKNTEKHGEALLKSKNFAGILLLCEAKPKSEIQRHDDKKGRFIYAVNGAVNLPIQMLYWATFKKSPNLQTDPARSQSLYGFSFAHGGFDTLFKVLQARVDHPVPLPEGDHFLHHLLHEDFTPIFADNIFPYYKYKDDYILCVTDVSSMEASHLQETVARGTRRMASANGHDLDLMWTKFATEIMPAVACGSRAVYGQQQFDVPAWPQELAGLPPLILKA